MCENQGLGKANDEGEEGGRYYKQRQLHAGIFVWRRVWRACGLWVGVCPVFDGADRPALTEAEREEG